MTDLNAPLTFSNGMTMKNRFMLAPLTNTQSHTDGTLSDDEYHWLTKRAEGGFGLTMTCAAHVQAVGQGFPGQLGVWDDMHIKGLTRLATKIKSEGSIAVCQLHHAGHRSPADLIGTQPVCPSDNERSGARGLTHDETKQLVADFIAAAVRAQKAGFDGVELHGAHGYILCQYFSATINQRTDEYGGSVENRYRILFEIIDGIRSQCKPDFLLGVRLSPERFGIQLGEALSVAQKLMSEDKIQFLDMSLWDCFMLPQEEEYHDANLIQHFAKLDRGRVRLGAAGSLRHPQDAERALESGADWVMLGRAAMWTHNFPKQYVANKRFEIPAPPYTRDYLRKEAISDTFINYIKQNWPESVAE